MTVARYPKYDGTQACAGADPELFFPADRAGDVGQQAINICSGCTFRRACLAYALTHNTSGIWGGTTELTRRAIRRKYGIRAISMELFDHSRTSRDDLEQEPA